MKGGKVVLSQVLHSYARVHVKVGFCRRQEAGVELKDSSNAVYDFILQFGKAQMNRALTKIVVGIGSQW